MPLPHDTVMFDVHDCKVAPLISDQNGALPVYGTRIDVPGISEVGLDPNFVTAELKGDARVIAKKGRIDRVNFSGTYGKLALDVQAVLIGTSVSDVAATSIASITGATTEDSATVTGTGYTLALVGRGITGTGIPAGTTIIGLTGSTTLTLSQPATADGVAVALSVAAEGASVVSRLSSPAPLPYFGLWFKIEDLDEGIGDLHVASYKCQITGGTLLGSSSDNFGQPSFDAEGIALSGHLVKPDNSGYDDAVIMDTVLLANKTSL